MSPNHKAKIFAIIGGLLTVAGIGGVYIFYRGKKIPTSKNPDAVKDTPAAQPIQSASSFPVQTGSSGNLVMQLQELLGVGADGKFGPQTLAALKMQTGKMSIATQAEYNQVITTLQNKPAIAAGVARANNLTSQFNSGSGHKLMAIEKVTAYQVIKDTYGALQPTGKTIQLAASQQLDRTIPYQLQGATQQGYLLVNVSGGDFKGLYKIDPAKLTVV